MAGSRFIRGGNPRHTLNIGIAQKVFQSCGKPYQEGGGYSFNYYGPDNWMDVIKWLLSKGYTPKETEEVMRSKLMRWASDRVGHDDGGCTLEGDCTLEDFLEFNYYQGRSEVNRFLDEYFPDPKRKNRINEDMAGAGSTPGMGNAVPASQAATTGNQFYQAASKGSGDKWGTTPKKKKKGKKVKLVKESLYEENINPYDKRKDI